MNIILMGCSFSVKYSASQVWCKK